MPPLTTLSKSFSRTKRVGRKISKSRCNNEIFICLFFFKNEGKVLTTSPSIRSKLECLLLIKISSNSPLLIPKPTSSINFFANSLSSFFPFDVNFPKSSNPTILLLLSFSSIFLKDKNFEKEAPLKTPNSRTCPGSSKIFLYIS